MAGESLLGRLSRHWWIAIVLIVTDQITKALVHQAIGPYDSPIAIIPGLVDLVHVRNEGVAFGLLNRVDIPFKPVVTSVLALAALGGIVWYARHLQAHERLARLGLACILGGAVGNLIDRVRQGYVLDFVDVYWNNWHFWAFNVADASITVGAILVFADLLLVKQHVSDPV